jgi:hypothetical protein
MNRYLVHLRRLESEGFRIMTANQRGMVLSRVFGATDACGQARGGWLASLLK